MEGRLAIRAAVVAVHLLCEGRELRGQCLCGQQAVQHAKVEAQVSNGAAADGARVKVLGVLGKARAVHEVAARHLLDRLAARKEVLVAEGAIGLHAALAAFVLVEERERHARVALHAVEEVDAQALTAAAHVAEGAVVDRAPCTQLTHTPSLSLTRLADVQAQQHNMEACEVKSSRITVLRQRRCSALCLIQAGGVRSQQHCLDGTSEQAAVPQPIHSRLIQDLARFGPHSPPPRLNTSKLASWCTTPSADRRASMSRERGREGRTGSDVKEVARAAVLPHDR